MYPINDPYKIEEAQSYLRERRFDPEDLWQRWRVMFCPASPTAKPWINWRIVAPVYDLRADLSIEEAAARPVFAGWQARRIEDGEDNKEPKYLTAKGMKKSRLLYGLTAAVRTKGPIVVVRA
jgi:hypothetical protein